VTADEGDGLAERPLPADQVGLLEGLTTTRAIRRYRPDPVPDELLRAVLFGASRAPSGSNRQPFRFVVLTDSPTAREVKRLLGDAARQVWDHKEARDGYRRGSGADPSSPKARMAETMRQYVDSMHEVPVVVLACLVRYREQVAIEGASVFPAVQNLLLSARAVGLGGVITGFHRLVEQPLRTLLEIPDEAAIAATVTLGWPAGGHGSVRRRPLREVVFEDGWGRSPAWAVDPPGTRLTAAGPPVG
jgi:nitroreductase